jgi:hypothetical protein
MSDEMGKGLNEQDLVKLGRAALEDSAMQLDAHTLSRLNQARQLAIAGKPGLFARWGNWLPLSAAGAAAVLALAIALPTTTPTAIVQQAAEDELALPLLAEEASMAAFEDRELLEDLDMMLWLLDVENHAS